MVLGISIPYYFTGPLMRHYGLVHDNSQFLHCVMPVNAWQHELCIPSIGAIQGVACFPYAPVSSELQSSCIQHDTIWLCSVLWCTFVCLYHRL